MDLCVAMQQSVVGLFVVAFMYSLCDKLAILVGR